MVYKTKKILSTPLPLQTQTDFTSCFGSHTAKVYMGMYIHTYHDIGIVPFRAIHAALLCLGGNTCTASRPKVVIIGLPATQGELSFNANRDQIPWRLGAVKTL